VTEPRRTADTRLRASGARYRQPVVRILRALVAAGGVAMVAAGVFLLLQWHRDDAAAQRYLDSPCTAHPLPAACPNVVDATVLSTHTDRDRVGTLRAGVTLAPTKTARPETLQGIWPNDAFLAMHPGTHVVVIEHDGRPATIRLDPDHAHPTGLRLWTVDNPVPDRDLLRDRGLAAGGLGLLALFLVAPPVLTRMPRRGLAAALGDRRLRIALLAFTVIQLLDVATSVAGRHRLLYEGVALTRSVVDRWGDLGFVAVKVPALLAVALLAARLPRRWALLPVVATAVPVAIVVGGNLRLLAG
jgi:hypothetical protein